MFFFFLSCGYEKDPLVYVVEHKLSLQENEAFFFFAGFLCFFSVDFDLFRFWQGKKDENNFSYLLCHHSGVDYFSYC